MKPAKPSQAARAQPPAAGRAPTLLTGFLPGSFVLGAALQDPPSVVVAQERPERSAEPAPEPGLQQSPPAPDALAETLPVAAASPTRRTSPPRELLQAIADRRGFAIGGIEPQPVAEQLEPIQAGLRSIFPSPEQDRADILQLVEREAVLTAQILVHHQDLWARFVSGYNPKLKTQPPSAAETNKARARCADALAAPTPIAPALFLSALQPGPVRGVRARLCRWVRAQADAAPELVGASNELEGIRARVVLRNLRAASRWSRHAYTAGLSWSERTLAAVTGMMRALDTIEPDGAAGYHTYARHWVKARVHKLALDHGHVARRSNHLSEVAMRLQAMADAAVARGGGPTLRTEELRYLALAAGETLPNIERVLLPWWVEEDDPERLDQMLGAEGLDPQREAQAVEQWFRLERGLRTLEATHGGVRKRRVLELRLGLGPTGKRVKLSVIGEQMGVGRERIRQIESEALAALSDLLALPLAQPLEVNDRPTSSGSPSPSS